jgi:hypothetical protein
LWCYERETDWTDMPKFSFGLFLLWAVLLVVGVTADATSGERAHVVSVCGRMGSSLVLVVAAWSWVLAARSRRDLPFCVFIAVGMTAGFLGDLLLAELLPVSDPTPAGMAAFGFGHLAYITGILFLWRRQDRSQPLLLAWLVWMVIGLGGWYVMVYPSSQPATLRWEALGYVLLLASTAGFASGLALGDRSYWPLALGAGLFLLSDLILATQLSRSLDLPFLGPAVWLTYGPAQMLIVYSSRQVATQSSAFATLKAPCSLQSTDDQS